MEYSLKISDRDSLVLAAIEHHPRATIGEIAKITGLREHTVRYIWQNILERKICVNAVPIINTYSFGYTHFVLYFSVLAADQKAMFSLTRNLAEMPGLIWLAELAGEFQYGMEIAVREISELQFLGKGHGARNLVVNRKLGALVRAHLYSSKFLTKKVPPSNIQYGAAISGRSESLTELDELDRKILTALSINGSASAREIARGLKLSSSTFDRRLKSLEERGVISGYLYRISQASLGLVRYKVQIQLRTINEETLKRIREFCLTHIAVTQLFEFVGQWDLEIGISIPSGSSLVPFMSDLGSAFGKEIAATATFPVIQSFKFNMQLPV